MILWIPSQRVTIEPILKQFIVTNSILKKMIFSGETIMETDTSVQTLHKSFYMHTVTMTLKLKNSTYNLCHVKNKNRLMTNIISLLMLQMMTATRLTLLSSMIR